MSFSTELKQELSKTENLANKEAVKYELIGYLITSHISEERTKIKFSTESEYNINRFSRLLSNSGINNYDISLQGKIFNITTSKKNLETIKCDIDNLNADQIKWVIRGTYLGGWALNSMMNIISAEI